jgi:hypothetical protein
MADSPQEIPAEKSNVWSSGLGKEYEVLQSKTRAFMVEDAQWDRLKGRVTALESRGGIEWLIAGATMLFGIAASAGLALVALPNATQNDSGELAPFVRPTLWAVLIGGALLALTMLLLWLHYKDDESKTAKDICSEMDTIHAAWQEREVQETVQEPKGGQ